MGMTGVKGTWVFKTLGVTLAVAGLLVGCSSDEATNNDVQGGVGSGSPGSPGSPGTGSNPPTAAPVSFWDGVGMADASTTLAKASVLFAGRNPTAAETTAAAGGDAALKQTIKSYMTGATFNRFLTDAADTQFLSRGVVVFGNNAGGLNATDWPTAAAVINNTNPPAGVRNRFQTAIQNEPIELVKYIVNNDKPWTDMVAGKYTVVNGVMAQQLNAAVTGTFVDANNDAEWLPATLPEQRLGGVREHAGVLSSHAWLNRFPTTPTNRNRHRVNLMMKQFLAFDLQALGTRPVNIPPPVAGDVTTVSNQNCSVCHNVMDPIAAGFQNWNEANRFLPNKSAAGKDIALPASYRAANYPKDAKGAAYYMEGDNWFRDEQVPGYLATPMPGGLAGSKTALQFVGAQVAGDSRFALGAVHFWYKALFGRNPLVAPNDNTSPQYATQMAAYTAQKAEFDAIAVNFKNSGFLVKDLLADLVLSKWYRANRVTTASAAHLQQLADLGSNNLLLPSQLNIKLMGLVGQNSPLFTDPFGTSSVNYSDFDGVARITRAKDYTMMQTLTIDRLVATGSCGFAMNDFNKPAASRLLFPMVEMAATPATQAGMDAITQNIRFLHKSLLKEDLAATDPEILRTVKLFTDVWNDRATAPARPTACSYNTGNDPNYTGRAWSTVLAYMIGDAKFLYE